MILQAFGQRVLLRGGGEFDGLGLFDVEKI